MDAEFIFKAIQLYGFPAVMCVWFMLRLEKRLDAIEATNHRQVVVMAVLLRILTDRKALGTIPENYFDAITGVDEIPLPDETSPERKLP